MLSLKSLLQRAKSVEGKLDDASEKRPVFIFGDSHTRALIQAANAENALPDYGSIIIRSIRKNKNGTDIGDDSLDEFCERIAGLVDDDHVFSAIGGNQYAVVSTIKHDSDFSILGRGENSTRESDCDIIPRRAFHSFIEGGVRKTDGMMLRKIRNATRARLFHLCPPPPKFDNSFIRQYHESQFAAAGLGKLEPTDPSLRLECWKIQKECLAEICVDLNITLLEPPALTVTPDGYLAPAYYRRDVTHANPRYGDQVLRQILETIKRSSNGIAE